MNSCSLCKTQDERSLCSPLRDAERVRMVVAEDGIHFVDERLADYNDPTGELVGLTFFSTCISRVIETFLAAADDVMMSSGNQLSRQPETANPKDRPRRPMSRSRLKVLPPTHILGSGDQIPPHRPIGQ
jgi:hypothetical protein